MLLFSVAISFLSVMSKKKIMVWSVKTVSPAVFPVTVKKKKIIFLYNTQCLGSLDLTVSYLMTHCIKFEMLGQNKQNKPEIFTLRFTSVLFLLFQIFPVSVMQLQLYVRCKKQKKNQSSVSLRWLVRLPAEERGAQQLWHRDLLSDRHAEYPRQHAAGAVLSDHL